MMSPREMADTFRASRVRVHLPRKAVKFCNPGERCSVRAVASISSGNASLSHGRYVTQKELDGRFARIMSAQI